MHYMHPLVNIQSFRSLCLNIHFEQLTVGGSTERASHSAHRSSLLLSLVPVDSHLRDISANIHNHNQGREVAVELDNTALSLIHVSRHFTLLILHYLTSPQPTRPPHRRYPFSSGPPHPYPVSPHTPLRYKEIGESYCPARSIYLCGWPVSEFWPRCLPQRKRHWFFVSVITRITTSADFECRQ